MTIMAKKGARAKLWRRSLIIMLIIIIAGFGTIAGRLFYLQTYMSEELQKKAVDQQLADTTLTAKRGSIYDSNGNILAQSITVWNVVMAPRYLKSDESRKIVADGLAKILELDEDELFEKTKQNSYYVVVKRKVETDVKEKVVKFANYISDEYGIEQVINTIEDYKRYYTHDNFAGDVLGFVGSDGQGLAGVEYQYDEYLTGKSGRLVIAQNALGTEMPFQYEQKVDAEDGYNIVLTIDENIQSIMEKYVRQTIKEFNVANRGCAIMMNVKTGAILGFACEGSFNPNDPFTVADEKTRKEIDKLPEDKQADAEYKALAKQWRNKGVSDTYIPGSVFKMITASAVLSEGLIKDNTRFNCSGSYVPFEGSGSISCWYYSGHGSQTLEQALCNSCNPAFMQMGFLLGREKFYEYYVSFGFSEKTGIDLPGESEDQFFQHEGINGMDLSDLAVASFGQNFAITPIQMLTACASIANGGSLMQPFVVSKIVDSSGNVVKTTEPAVKRQAISKDVAKQICGMLERNAIDGGATNGYVAGYRIGGKTGTSEKKVDEYGNLSSDYIASFCGIAPSDDPEIALLCYFDTPDKNINYYGSAVAGPCFRNIMSEVLPYLGVEKIYSDAEMTKLDTTTSAYYGMSVEAAQSQVKNDGLKYEVVGSGKNVIAQNPAAYSTIPKDGTVVLYTDTDSTKQRVTVPDFTNCTLSEANVLASDYNLNLCIKGSSLSEGTSYAKSQDIKAGTEVEPYTVITVTFNQDNSIM